MAGPAFLKKRAIPETSMPIKFAAARFTEQEALQFHSQGKPGKLEITPTKPLTTQRDLSLAYSPGVAVPVLAIAAGPAASPTTTPPRATWSPSSPTARPSSASAISARWRPSR